MRRDLLDKLKNFLVTAIALTGIIVLVLLFSFIIKEALQAIQSHGLEIFTSGNWYPTYGDTAEYGLLIMIADSLLITLLASLFVLPLGYIIAFFMYNYATKKEKRIIKSAIDLLSGVPSVIIGTFLLIYVSPILVKIGAEAPENILLAAIGLTIISLPYTASLMEEALDSVDKSIREGALALGCTRFTATFRIVSKAAISGLLNAVILTVNRIIGETMIVLMAGGGAAIIPQSLYDPVRTLTAVIASEMGEVAKGDMHYSTLFVAGLILLVISFVLTLISKEITRRWKHG